MVCVIAFIACDSGDDDFRKVTILLWRIINTIERGGYGYNTNRYYDEFN